MARGERLENRDLGFDAAAVDQDGFDGFGDAVAADAFGAVARHQADDEGAGDGDGHLPERREVVAAGETRAVLQRPKKKRLVKRPMSRSSARAMKALTKPMAMARAEIGNTRGVVVKSPSFFLRRQPAPG